MRSYVIVDVTINDPDTYKTYVNLAPPAIAKYGGKYLVRGAKTTIMEGTWDPKRFVILEFPDADKARAWWSSPEYAAAKKLRQSCATTQMLLVEGPPFDPASA